MKTSTTASERFDPFTDRLSRDIRNSLSEAFINSLTHKDRSFFANTAEQWLSGSLSSVYADYIEKRLERYHLVFDQIDRLGITEALRQTVLLWNAGLFFEVHEHVESIWHKTSGDEREALKGLIKAAGVYVHLELDHQQAAQNLAGKAEALLRKYRHVLSFISNLDDLLKSLKAVDSLPPQLDLPFP